MKRILFMMFLIGLNALNAASISSAKDVYKLGETIHIKVKDLEYHPKNWIAIYPKAKSSAGSNVIRWKWTKEITDGEFVFKTVGKVISTSYLPEGEYEARVMYKNSYTPAVSVGFSVGNSDQTTHSMDVKFKKINAPWNDNQMIQLIFNTSSSTKQIGEKKQNWIAIYKKGSSNNWKNVITWAWVKDLQNGIAPGDSLKNRYFEYKLPDGEYELRFFLKNSYTTFASFTFEANAMIDNPQLLIKKQTKNNITFSSTYTKKSWIGIFERKFNFKTNKEDAKAWSWVESDVTSINLSDLPRDDYTAKLFYNNSEKTEKTINFSHNGINQDNFVKIDKFNGYNRIDFSSSVQVAGKKSWIGLYKKGTSNDSKNRLAWKTINKTHNVIYLSYLKKLEIADYELRLFYDNEDNMVAKTEFKVDGKQIFRQKKNYYGTHRVYRMYQDLTHFAPMDKYDWVGLFEKGAEKIQENLLSRGMPQVKGGRNLVIFKTPGRVGTFELVYFTDSGYNQVGNPLLLTFN